MKRTMATLAAAVALAVALAGCGQGKPVSGRVTDKDRDVQCSKVKRKKKATSRRCHTEYELTLRTKRGEEAEVHVSWSDFRACRLGAKYPRCTHG